MRDGCRLLCQNEGMQPRISALGRERDAPGQTSALTLGPGPWLLPAPCQPLFRLSLAGHETQCRVAGRGGETAQALTPTGGDRAGSGRELGGAKGHRGWAGEAAGLCLLHTPPAHRPVRCLRAGEGQAGPLAPHSLAPAPCLAQETPPQPSRSPSTVFAWILSSI